MIEACELVFAYKKQKVIDGVNITLSRGEIVSLVGPNGAGKSTILKCIVAIIRPQGGHILIDGLNPFRLPRKALARQITYLPQSTRFRFSCSVFETVLAGRRPHFSWRPSRVDLEKVQEAIVRLGLSSMAARNVDELSGGQQQKVLLARTLVQETPYLLLDEPNTGLDLRHQLEILEIVAEQAKAHNVGILMALHDINLAARFSDRMLMVNKGKVIVEGRPEEVITEEVIRKVYGVEAKVTFDNGNIFVRVLGCSRISRSGFPAEKS